MFSTKYKLTEPTYSNSGDVKRMTYRYEYDENGERILVNDDFENTDDKIQLYRDVNNIDMLIARYANGDPTALNQTNGIYADFSDMPKSLSEIYERIDKANEEFNKLPTDVKEAFNNSPNEFYNRIVDGSAEEIIHSINKQIDVNITVADDKTDTSEG